MPSQSTLSDQSKTQRITTNIRQQLISGRIEPGGKLPTYDELERIYKVSRATLRQVINTLKQEGLIHTAGRGGMFAALTPNYTNRFGIAFPPVNQTIPRFWSAINLAIIAIQAEHPIQFSVYQNVNAQTPTPAYNQLLEDMHHQKLTGLFIIDSEDFKHCAPDILDEASTPKLAVCHAAHGQLIHNLELDMGNWHRRAMSHLAQQGCQRIALLKHQSVSCEAFAHTRAEELGLELLDQNILNINCHEPQPARQMIRLLMSQPADQRPDGLLIADDNFVEYASAGLIQANVAVGSDVHVVAHCNWPWLASSVIPVRRLGFHASHMFYFGIRAINQIRQGKEPASRYLNIPALFEDEAVPEEKLTVH